MMAATGMFLFIALVGIEFSWLYAWAYFLMTALFHRLFPLGQGLCIFALAVAFTSICRGRNWRIIHVLSLQALGMVFAGSWLVHFFNYPSYPYLNYAWVFECFRTSRGVLEWFFLALILFLSVLFWIEGVRFAMRSGAYLSVCARFDLGLSALFLLFLLKFVALLKGGIVIPEGVSTFMVFPFFAFGLTAIGLARNQSEARKEFLVGYRSVGMILSFAVLVLLTGTAGVTLFLPYLTRIAEVGYGVMQRTAKPLGPVVIGILRFLLMGRPFRQQPHPAPSKGMETVFGPHHESSWWSELLGRILSWGFLGILGIFLAVVSGIAMWYLVKWLFSRTARGEKRFVKRGVLQGWGVALRAMFSFLWEKTFLRLRGFTRAVQLYGALLRWGRHSGLPVLATETPLEYGLRLMHRFPALRGEIDTIINAFNLEVYGGTPLMGRQWTDARWAWRRLRSPLNWPSRLKPLFVRPAVDSYTPPRAD